MSATAVIPLPRLLFTVPQAAESLAIGRTRVYELVEAGDLELVHVGRLARIPETSLRAYVERLRTLAAGAA